jgi:hypothetical protein
VTCFPSASVRNADLCAVVLLSITTFLLQVHHLSCLNGWTFGNIAGSARDLSMFYRDLFINEPPRSAVTSGNLTRAAQVSREEREAAVRRGNTPVDQRSYDVGGGVGGGGEDGGVGDGVGGGGAAAASLLPADLLVEMQRWRNLTNEWTDGWGELGIYYGLALFHSGEFARLVVPGTGDGATTPLLGHPGGDYGSSSSPVCGYNTEYRFGLCVLMPSAQVRFISTIARQLH